MRLNGCCTPEKFDCAGNANRLGAVARVSDSIHTLQSQLIIQPRVGNVRPTSARDLADTVHRVVVVGSEHEPRPRAEPERLGDQAHRAARVGRKDHLVLARIRREERERQAAGILNDLRAAKRRDALRVRIAEHRSREELEMATHMRLRVQRAAGVVEIRFARTVQAAELAAEAGEPGVPTLTAA